MVKLDFLSLNSPSLLSVKSFTTHLKLVPLRQPHGPISTQLPLGPRGRHLPGLRCARAPGTVVSKIDCFFLACILAVLLALLLPSLPCSAPSCPPWVSSLLSFLLSCLPSSQYIFALCQEAMIGRLEMQTMPLKLIDATMHLLPQPDVPCIRSKLHLSLCCAKQTFLCKG